MVELYAFVNGRLLSKVYNAILIDPRVYTILAYLNREKADKQRVHPQADIESAREIYRQLLT